MIDLHSHINFIIDDGARSIEESVAMATTAREMGYTKILCTSHFKSPRFVNENYEKNFYFLQKELKKRGIGIEILMGNELFMEPENIKALAEGKVKSMGNSKYLLVESESSIPYIAYRSALKEIERLGYIPVLAHIERYFFNLQEIRELNKSYPTQVNISSINMGMKKRVAILLEKNLVDILATDSHRDDGRSYELSKEIAAFRELIGEKKFQLLTKTNPERILNDKDVEKWEGDDEKFEKTYSNQSVFARIFNDLVSRIRARSDS